MPHDNDLPSCSCLDQKASRRSVLKGMGVVAGAAAFSSITGGVFRQVAYADGITNGHVLVVLSLRGGADGLSMVVPYGDAAYAAARPRTAVPAGQLIATDGFFGLHPSLAPLQAMWQSGKMAAIHAVGLPQPNRSHFDALEKLELADPGSTARVGWLNRLAGLEPGLLAREAMALGTPSVPTSMQGPTQVLGLRSSKGVALPGAKTGVQSTWKHASLSALYNTDATALGRAGQAGLEASDQLGSVGSMPSSPTAVYSKSPFGLVMADTARLIKAQVGVEVVTIDFGNWDMHVGIGTLTSGLMAPKLTELATSLAGFYDDLGALADNVTLVTISEFGRRVVENNDAGADHGYGNVMLALGSGVVGGQVYTSWPGLGSESLIAGDLAVTRDYRSVLTEVLRSRTSADTSQVFPSFSPEPALGFMTTS